MSEDFPKLDPKIDAWRRQSGALTKANAKYRNSDQRWADLLMSEPIYECESPEHAEAIVREMGSMEAENNRLRKENAELRGSASSMRIMDDKQFEKILELLISIRSWMCFIGGAIVSAILVI